MSLNALLSYYLKDVLFFNYDHLALHFCLLVQLISSPVFIFADPQYFFCRYWWVPECVLWGALCEHRRGLCVWMWPRDATRHWPAQLSRWVKLELQEGRSGWSLKKCRRNIGRIDCHRPMMLIILIPDTDECLTTPCQQHCQNSIGSYQCSCHPGFYLHGNQHSCVGEWFCFCWRIQQIPFF